MKQKFRKLSFVRIRKEMPSYMSHFPSDCDAIVEGTYSQEYGGDDIKSYSLYLIEGGKVYNSSAWYEEDQLSLLDEQDRDKAEDMVEEYTLRDFSD